MSWVAHLVQTMTGQKGAQLDLAAEGAWTLPAMGIEDWSVTVLKAQLRRLDPDWWAPWKASVLMSWQAPDGRLVPWLLGPITQPPAETRTTAAFTCKGLGALFEHRVVLDRDYGRGTVTPTLMTALAKSQVRREGMSLGTIAQDIVQLCTQEKLGGHLPIRYGSPRETGGGLNERTYQGFNLANNGLWKRLTEISEVRRGPDIQFRPAFVNDDQSLVEWVMVHGTVAQPQIAQNWTMDLDTTSSLSPVADVDIKTDADALTNRVYWTGAGEDAGTLVRMVQDTEQLADYMPLLEKVGSTSDSENASLIEEHANATLDAGAEPLQQITVRVDGADPRAQIGRWHVGDTARVTLGDDWLTVPAGTRPLRIIAAKGTWSSSMVDLEFQEEAAT